MTVPSRPTCARAHLNLAVMHGALKRAGVRCEVNIVVTVQICSITSNALGIRRPPLLNIVHCNSIQTRRAHQHEVPGVAAEERAGTVRVQVEARRLQCAEASSWRLRVWPCPSGGVRAVHACYAAEVFPMRSFVEGLLGLYCGYTRVRPSYPDTDATAVSYSRVLSTLLSYYSRIIQRLKFSTGCTKFSNALHLIDTYLVTH